MIWAFLWTVLVIGAAAVLFVLGRRLWRQTKVVAAELGVAGDRLSDATDRLADLDPERATGRTR